ncbi:FHF complex subunit HOOK interacting protein 1B-like [Amphibalanus amphitrite]|uniref:FHF complex subunit HOOK interacting protein 1B-like n=1 Tax=Amphibalanus amphitrite TaxID=1232801 RepID=UPI001C9246DC|nr:FHF complex subunit HOOK interacting protein 1B-like [Amphibalanus amphitrite]
MSSWLQKAPFGDSILARFRTSLPVKDEVDIDVCVESFHSHWEQAWTKMQAHQDGTVAVTMDEVNTVLNHTDQLRVLVCWELEQQQGSLPGRLADLFLSNRVPERLLSWSSCCGQFEPLLQSELLRVFEQLLRAGGGSLLEQRALLRPLTALLVRCRSAPAAEQHRRLVLVLAQLCAALQARPALLDLFLGVEPDGSVSSCVVFSLLVEFVHSAGVVGATAREALLRCTRLSADSRPLAEFIVHHSDFCEVLATGLSGLYSALPRTPPAEDEDLPEVDAFVCSLQFCNAVLQTCHPMVSAVLLELVYQGFLVSVMGPALHQSSSEAVVTATTYLELCIRSVDHPGLVRALVRLLLRHRHDGVAVIDTLVQRIAATSRLAVATLSLLHTLLNLNCEDVLLELVLRHLLPCSHLMASQRSRVTETDLYGAGARRLLSLIPACCQPAAAADPRAAAAAWLQCVREARLALTACKLATSRWTYAYDGSDPSPAEAERMTRRRPSSVGSLSLLGMEERGEADGETGGEEAATAAAGTRLSAVVGGGPGGSPVVHSWRLGRLQETGTAAGERAGSPQSDTAADESSPDARHGEQTSNDDGKGVSSNPDSLQSNPDGLGSDGGSEAGSSDASVKSQVWATPPRPRPPRRLAAYAAGPDPYPELDLSEGDVWATPRTSLGASRVGPADDTPRQLGVLAILPDEESSGTESSRGGGGEPVSLSGAEVIGEEVRRDSGAVAGSIDSAEEAVVALGEDGGLAGTDPSLVEDHIPAASGPVEGSQGQSAPDVNSSLQSGIEESDADDGSHVVSLSDLISTHCPSDSEDDGDRPAPVNAQDATSSENATTAADRSAQERSLKPAKDTKETVSPCRDLSTFVERHGGTVRAPPPPPGSAPVSGSGSVPQPPLLSERSAGADTTTAVPTIGPFLLALLERLDRATTNSLQLNLLLMSVISRLAHYPQPLLRSLLLNPTLVCQPSVRSLIQTLGSLKHRIDLATRSVQDAPGLVRWARSRLEARPAAAGVAAPASPGLVQSPAGPGSLPSPVQGLTSGPASLPAQLGGAQTAAAASEGDSGGFSLTGLAGRLRRALPAVSLTMENSDQPRRRPADIISRTSVGPDRPEWDASERRVALTAVLLEQWLAELAAVALEHSVATDRLVFAF